MAADLIKTLRKNWKKSLFATGVFLWGSSYAAAKYRDELTRREFCEKAKTYGDQKSLALEKPRKIYVILNCEGANGKAKKLYEKNVAPILHLSGIDVTLIKTSYEGHAKAIVNYLDPGCDGLVVAGGDGTVMEAVTGLFRLADHERYKDMPFGVLPLGTNNSFFKKLFPPACTDVRTIGNGTMAIVEGKYKLADVMQIKTNKRNVYALSSFHWGSFQSLKARFDTGRLWWTGILRKYLLLLYAIAKDNKGMDVGETDFERVQHNTEQPSGDACQPANSEVLRGDEFCSLSAYLVNGEHNESSSLKLQFWPKLPTQKYFKEGLGLMERSFQFSQTDMSNSDTVKKISVTPANSSMFEIDGESFDSQPVEISIANRKLKVFCPSG